jgi:outer membrane lipoprotein
MKRFNEILVSVSALIFICSGCIRAISKELRAQVTEEVKIKQVLENPDDFLGKMVIWGGVIVESKNLKEGTLIEIVQKPLSSEERPKKADQSDGRFIALFNSYLDVAIYSEGREVTVAGRIREIRQRPLGEIEYTYPVISADEVHLWPLTSEKSYYIYSPYRYYPHPYRWDPWYW